MDWLKSEMPEYTSRKSELDSAKSQNAVVLRASERVRSASAGGPAGSVESNSVLRFSGPFRTAIHASGATTSRSAQPTPDHAVRHPNDTTALPTLGRAAMNPTPTSSE